MRREMRRKAVERPLDQAVPNLTTGVYAMTAQPDNKAADDYDDLATQWFIVSDLGVTAYSGSDGIHAFVHSLASTDARAGIELKLIARNNEVLAVRKTDAAGAVNFEPGLARGEGGMAPALLLASDAGASDFAFLNLKGPAFDLSDRGVNGRAVPAAPNKPTWNCSTTPRFKAASRRSSLRS